MKKVLFTILFLVTFYSYSQESERQKDSIALVKKKDSLLKSKIDRKIDSIDALNKIREKEALKDKERYERYKLYPTQNIYNFIKLDTSTGELWKVQWSTETDKRFETFLGGDAYYDILKDEGIEFSFYDYERPVGRFELIPTQNIYNFILIDTFKGDTWQVQWSFEASKRLVLKIE